MLSCLGIVGTVFQQQQTVAFPYYEKKKKWGGGRKKERKKKTRTVNYSGNATCRLGVKMTSSSSFLTFYLLE